jgi:hypothetical protein
MKKKSEIAAAVEQHALDRLRVVTESLSCKKAIASLSSPPEVRAMVQSVEGCNNGEV